MNDQRFFDLAMKVIARQSSDAERHELDALLASHPELETEFEQLRAEARVAKEVLPLLAATEATAGELPAYARERLQTKVRQTFGRPAPAKRPVLWGWKWALAFASATAVIVLVWVGVVRQSPQPVIQIAMLDLAGPTRGGGMADEEVLRNTWQAATVESFSSAGGLEAWEKNWPDPGRKKLVRIIYHRSAGELRVLIRSGTDSFQRAFPVDGDLPAALNQVKACLGEHKIR
ncbi:MAG: hypothetical protein HYY24_20450 [Verrucomicrobia bacterium]|nr:hypothetical protein [Verrucomicrobiota bacterium]